MQQRANYDRHPTRTTVEWTTPREIIEALGPFDLDPCTHESGMPWATASTMWTVKDDGLASEWDPHAFVWHNPPYGRGQDQWMRKAAEHGNGLTLVLSRTDASWFHRFVFGHPNATGVLFTLGRIQFRDRAGEAIGRCPVGATFVAYGEEAYRRLDKALASGALRGHLLRLAHVRAVAPAHLPAAND